MKIYFKTATREIAVDPDPTSVESSLSGGRPASITTTAPVFYTEDNLPVELYFLNESGLFDIGTPEIKIAVGSGGVIFGLAEEFSKGGVGAGAKWTGSLNLNTQQSHFALQNSDELTGLPVLIEVEVRNSGSVLTAKTTATLKSDLINETDSQTDIGSVTSIGQAHINATTNVHGIANTEDLATNAIALQFINDHNSETQGVHGIADTASIVTEAKAVAFAIALG